MPYQSGELAFFLFVGRFLGLFLLGAGAAGFEAAERLLPHTLDGRGLLLLTLVVRF